MPKKEFRNPGKGNRPVMGYNPKKWNENFDTIDWRRGKIRTPTNPAVKELVDKILSPEQHAFMKEQLERDLPDDLKFPMDFKLGPKK